jgi:hypothetical protein
MLAACGRIGFDLHDSAVAPDAAPSFVDTFDGPDSNTLPNAWIEKRANVFGIASNQVTRLDYATDYRDNITYRPSNEDLLDTEASIEFTVGHVPPGYPQVFVRIQQATVTTPNTLDGYILYIDGGTTSAKITRQLGTVLPPELASFALSPALELGVTYRLRLRATGPGPVVLDCYVEQQNGAAWIAIGHVLTMDSDTTAIVTPGAVGFSAGQPEATGYYTYDNFTRTPL